MAGTISFDVNNQRKLMLTQDTHDGETRIVKAGYRRKGEKPQVATYTVHFVGKVALDAFEDERLNGGKCSCGAHRLRDALAHSHDCACAHDHAYA